MTLEDLKNNIDRILMESPELRLREVVVKDTAEREIFAIYGDMNEKKIIIEI